MKEPDRPRGASPGAEQRPAREPGAPEYSGPGAWGAAALWLLGGLFVISAALTAHSILATFGG